MSFSGGQHTEGLVGPTMVVEQDPVADHAAGVLLGLEPMAVDALLLEGLGHHIAEQAERGLLQVPCRAVESAISEGDSQPAGYLR